MCRLDGWIGPYVLLHHGQGKHADVAEAQHPHAEEHVELIEAGGFWLLKIKSESANRNQGSPLRAKVLNNATNRGCE